MFILDDVFQIKNRGVVVTGVWDSDETIAMGDHVRRRSDGKHWPVCGIETYAWAKPLERGHRIGLLLGIRCTRDDFERGDVFEKTDVAAVPTNLVRRLPAARHIDCSEWGCGQDGVCERCLTKIEIADAVLAQLAR